MNLFYLNAAMHNIQRGFTLPEVLISITLVSSLSAMALPQLDSLKREARIAQLQVARSAMISSSNLAQAAYLLRRGQSDKQNCAHTLQTADNINSLCTSVGLIAMRNGYPQALSPNQGNGIVTLAGLSTAYSFSGGGSTHDSRLVIQVSDAPHAALCSFSYQAGQIGNIEDRGC